MDSECSIIEIGSVVLAESFKIKVLLYLQVGNSFFLFSTNPTIPSHLHPPFLFPLPLSYYPADRWRARLRKTGPCLVFSVQALLLRSFYTCRQAKKNCIVPCCESVRAFFLCSQITGHLNRVQTVQSEGRLNGATVCLHVFTATRVKSRFRSAVQLDAASSV